VTLTDSPFAGPPRARRARLIRIGLLVVLLAAAAGAVWLLAPSGAPVTAPAGHNHSASAATTGPRLVMLPEAEARRIGVTFAVAAVGPLEREFRTVAQVTYDEARVTSITTKVDGWVDGLFLSTTGQSVQRGEAIFALYSPMIVTAEQDLILARQLARDVSSGTEDARSGAEALTTSARRRLQYWDVPENEIARVEQSGQVSRAVTMRAAVSGVVLEKLVLQGQRIMAGDPIYRIADLSTIWVEGQVFERDLPAVRIGQKVSAEFQALPGKTRTGTISYISPVLGAETRTATIRVVLPNPGLELKPGMYATLRFSAATASTLSIPRSAVLVTGARALAFLKRADGAFEPRELTLGIMTDELVEVLHGLSVGDTVVASATFLVDAESNLGTIMGGMGGMPGMDIKPQDSLTERR
jgi:Cu(I)/Ag(I) efflux system membrane fusion protein